AVPPAGSPSTTAVSALVSGSLLPAALDATTCSSSVCLSSAATSVYEMRLFVNVLTFLQALPLLSQRMSVDVYLVGVKPQPPESTSPVSVWPTVAVPDSNGVPPSGSPSTTAVRALVSGSLVPAAFEATTCSSSVCLSSAAASVYEIAVVANDLTFLQAFPLLSQRMSVDAYFVGAKPQPPESTSPVSVWPTVAVPDSDGAPPSGSPSTVVV